MDGWILIAIIAVVAVIAVAAIWLLTQRQRTSHLREGFGSEYDRTVDQYGNRSQAESELTARQKRVEKLHLRPLSSGQRTLYTDAWRATQAHFVDDPAMAIGEADDLVGQVMEARGYPVGDFEQRAADVSVDHPDVVSNYRAAHRIAGAQSRGDASTEDLRQAMVHYRALFEDLLETERTEARR